MHNNKCLRQYTFHHGTITQQVVVKEETPAVPSINMQARGDVTSSLKAKSWRISVTNTVSVPLFVTLPVTHTPPLFILGSLFLVDTFPDGLYMRYKQFWFTGAHFKEWNMQSIHFFANECSRLLYRWQLRPRWNPTSLKAISYTVKSS